MKSLRPVFDQLENVFVNQLGFILRKKESTITFRVFEVPTPRFRRNYVILNGRESPDRCVFNIYCYSTTGNEFNKDYLPTDLPEEVGAKDVAAFDIGILKGGRSVGWSLYNDRLTANYDGVFRGSPERIRERGNEIVQLVLQTIKECFLPLMEKWGNPKEREN